MLNYCLLDTTCFTYEENNFIWVTSLRDRKLTTPNITTRLNQSYEKMCQHPLREDSVKLAYMVELSSRNHCWGSKTMSKGSSGSRCAKTEPWNSPWDWRIKIRDLWVKRVYVRRRDGERAETPCIIPTIEYGRSTVMVWEAFANCNVEDVHQVKGQFNKTGYHSILQHHVTPSGTRLVGHQGFVHAR